MASLEGGRPLRFGLQAGRRGRDGVDEVGGATTLEVVYVTVRRRSAEALVELAVVGVIPGAGDDQRRPRVLGSRIMSEVEAVVGVDQDQAMPDAGSSDDGRLEQRPTTLPVTQLLVSTTGEQREPCDGDRWREPRNAEIARRSRDQDLAKGDRLAQEPSPTTRVVTIEVERHV